MGEGERRTQRRNYMPPPRLQTTNPAMAAMMTPATPMIGSIVDSEYADQMLFSRVVLVAFPLVPRLMVSMTPKMSEDVHMPIGMTIPRATSVMINAIAKPMLPCLFLFSFNFPHDCFLLYWTFHI
jgi:hypothetical protein